MGDKDLEQELFLLSRQTEIECDAWTKPIQNAKRILRRDIFERVAESNKNNSIRLTLSPDLPDEGYRVCVEPSHVTIEYKCDLGAVYGLLSISERFLGTKPFDFWNGRSASFGPSVEIPCGQYESPAYAIRFRCWMINDEVLLDGWKDNQVEELDVWAMIFETILRCGGNMVIPGTDRKNDELSFMAMDAGLWLTQHHTELLGARMFARVYPDLTPSYSKYPEQFEALWKEAIEKFSGRKVLWAVGYRGQGDYAFWEAEKDCDSDAKRGGVIGGVIRRQIELVREKNPDALFCTNLYGEMMDLYRKGVLEVPGDVIRIWGDNGYGKMVSRRQGNDNPRVPSMPDGRLGRDGLYYHASFYDLQAANHITMSPNPPEMLATELSQAVRNGAGSCWVINVGCIKPHVYVLDLVRELWTWGNVDIDAHARAYAQAYYGDESVAPLLLGYSKCTVPYGSNADDKAGDQYYHFPLRAIARRLLRGKTQETIPELHWAEGNLPFSHQVRAIGERAKAGVTDWQKYLRDCEWTAAKLDAYGKQLLTDTLILQAKLHLTGCEGMRDFCRAVLSALNGNHVDAYLHAHRALLAHRAGVEALREAEHGRFENFYRNECFSNVRLTVSILEAVRCWLRVCFDEWFYTWEQRYLTPREDTLVKCLTHRTNQLDDDTLCEMLLQTEELSNSNRFEGTYVKRAHERLTQNP